MVAMNPGHRASRSILPFFNGGAGWRFGQGACALDSSKMASRPEWLLRCRPAMSLAILLLLACCNIAASDMPYIPESEVTHWAVRFGRQIYEYSKLCAFVDEIQQGFINGKARVERKDGLALVKEMTGDIETMVAGKINAVKRITETVEQVMVGHTYDPSLGLTFEYNNAKKLNKPKGPSITLTPNEHFYHIPVNTSNSSIHVPINVYENAPNVVNAIKWSDHLNYIFESNYQLDPSLSWQYFGSSTGFLRQYPAVEWRSVTTDTYDCRMRSWYIQAANSPKDMVILIDNSGSMTGLRKEIAKHVALNILDTLGDDDHFNIYMFNNTLKCLVACYNDTLVPASMENIRLYKQKIQKTETKDIANFTLALTAAFQLLEQTNHSGNGSQCNQAIMLITDGAPHQFEELFKQYNEPERRVRVFTYFIGQEMSDVQEVEAIACNNRGFYSHVSTIAEARDQVQNYVPVMSRPLVLHQENTTIWTSVYADITDPKMSDWRWDRHEKERNKQRVKQAHDIHNEMKGIYLDYELEPRRQIDESDLFNDELEIAALKKSEDSNILDEDGVKLYRLMTTVASPAFDRSKYPDIRANLLGVAGIDVPIEEITKLAPAHKLGVNGYSFAITNNGYLIFHPDLRPVFADSLKPDYNTVDISEVELRDDETPPREFDQEFLKFREKMVNRETSNSKMSMKLHMDGQRRIATRRYNYHYAPIQGTPFSFGIALPEDYGLNKVVGEIDLKNASFNILSLFEDLKWRVHPKWIYCSYIHPNTTRPKMSAEESLIHFLTKATNHGFKWDTSRVRQPPTESDYRHKNYMQMDKNKVYCDTELLQSLIFDAKATKLVDKHTKTDKIEQQTAKKHGITMSFMATRSGLTRWNDYTHEEFSDAEDFINKNNAAVDEIWYKRAVDFNFRTKEAFVFSVPFHDAKNSSNETDTYVTGSRAIYLDNLPTRAPAAVVGAKFKHSAFAKIFFKITSECVTPNCQVNCSSEVLDCYLLDDHGFVVVSEDPQHTGQFFGQVDGMIMNALVNDSIFKKVHMIDYQAICIDKKNITNSASILFTPIRMAELVFTWMWSKLTTLYIHAHLLSWWKSDFFVFGSVEYSDLEATRPRLSITKRTPRPCDEQYYLYQLQPKRFNNSQRNIRLSFCSRTQSCGSSCAAKLVPYTNLMLLVVDTSCICEKNPLVLEHTEIKYNDSQNCQQNKFNIYRRKPSHCVSYHPLELEIKECGAGCSTLLPSPFVLIIVILILLSSPRIS